MKTLVLGALLCSWVSASLAVLPSRELLSTCLSAEATSASVQLQAIPTNEVVSDDDYRRGYQAPYLIQVEGRDLGYAQKGESHALIYRKQVFPLRQATNISGKEGKPVAFDPHLAEWLLVSQGNERFICVSFNFDGLGRSGRFQQVRGAYLLPANGPTRLLFTVGRIQAKGAAEK